MAMLERRKSTEALLLERLDLMEFELNDTFQILGDTLSKAKNVLNAAGESLAKWFANLSPHELNISIEKAFRRFDEDASGTLQRSEIQKAFAMMGKRFTDEDLDIVLKEYDANGDGCIDLDNHNCDDDENEDYVGIAVDLSNSSAMQEEFSHMVKLQLKVPCFTGCSPCTICTNNQEECYVDSVHEQKEKKRLELQATFDKVMEDAALSMGELLAPIPIFSWLQTEDRERLGSESRLLHFCEGEEVVRAGEESVSMFVVVQGEVAVLVGGNQVFSFLPGHFFGETGLIKNEKRNATIVASSPSSCLEISRDTFRRFLQGRLHSQHLHAELKRRKAGKVDRSQSCEEILQELVKLAQQRKRMFESSQMTRTKSTSSTSSASSTSSLSRRPSRGTRRSLDSGKDHAATEMHRSFSVPSALQDEKKDVRKEAFVRSILTRAASSSRDFEEEEEEEQLQRTVSSPVASSKDLTREPYRAMRRRNTSMAPLQEPVAVVSSKRQLPLLKKKDPTPLPPPPHPAPSHDPVGPLPVTDTATPPADAPPPDAGALPPQGASPRPLEEGPGPHKDQLYPTRLSKRTTLRSDECEDEVSCCCEEEEAIEDGQEAESSIGMPSRCSTCSLEEMPDCISRTHSAEDENGAVRREEEMRGEGFQALSHRPFTAEPTKMGTPFRKEWRRASAEEGRAVVDPLMEVKVRLVHGREAGDAREQERRERVGRTVSASYKSDVRRSSNEQVALFNIRRLSSAGSNLIFFEQKVSRARSTVGSRRRASGPSEIERERRRSEEELKETLLHGTASSSRISIINLRGSMRKLKSDKLPQL
ncbi:hypothetical protein GUITHDRAFT_146637 [Guillardia theta CCMP2712]|uniref:Calmodulin n=1 Tax=Guillardia theta (strain CCMP2712) TaxID=905079 RepID=L1IGL5_GUITC|nr:hypothetical protein GUITHDRAFT_146637 [Guillardia theta CCMP2712]EKX35227.1 hypothetical protein GUITHDRAFT_146637 [Guillardia theta CCMP2712]|eukprot:XP_005822207.1 hypothetical protein GUITHDRAFT_146637 [Guillardia theta CCMP2712]